MKFEDNKLKLMVTLFGENDSEYETEALIDTGATLTIIPTEISDLLELPEDKEMPKMQMITAGGVIEVSRKIVKEMRMGEIVLKNVEVAIHRLPDPIEVKVLIGMNVLERITLIIEGKKKEFFLKE